MIRSFVMLVALFFATIPDVSNAQSARSVIHDKAEQVRPLLPGMKAPAFDVRDVEGNSFGYDPGGMQKPLVLTFFRGGWCPYCNLHLAEMRHAEQELNELGFDIWFISVDKPEVLYASLDEPDIGYMLYSDSKLEATRAFGLAFRMTEDMVARYLEYDVDLEEASGEDHHVLPAPSTFIIGVDGIINFQYTNPDYHVRLHPDVLLAAARAYKNEAGERLNRRYKAQRQAQ